MLRQDSLSAAAEEFTAAALVGEGFKAALARLAAAAGGHDATLLVGFGAKIPSIIATPDITEPVADFMAGRSPPSSRQFRVNHSIRSGFSTDHDDYTEEELKTDPFYQEFLKPIGYFWHANVRLLGDQQESIELSIKRLHKAGSYDRDEVEELNRVLPELRAAVRVARRVLDAQSAGMACLLQHRGEPVFELDGLGRVLRAHGITESDRDPVLVLRRRLVCVDHVAQRDLDAAVAAAVTGPRRPSVAVLRDCAGAMHYLQCFPVPGQARDVFLASAAVAVLIRHEPRRVSTAVEPMILREAFGLTERESELAVLVREGMDLGEVAATMGVQIGTVRNHLKSIFDKTSTRRQGELASLLGRFRP